MFDDHPKNKTPRVIEICNQLQAAALMSPISVTRLICEMVMASLCRVNDTVEMVETGITLGLV